MSENPPPQTGSGSNPVTLNSKGDMNLYKIVDEVGMTYALYTYSKESEFESMIVSNACLLYTSLLYLVKRNVWLFNMAG